MSVFSPRNGRLASNPVAPAAASSAQRDLIVRVDVKPLAQEKRSSLLSEGIDEMLAEEAAAAANRHAAASLGDCDPHISTSARYSITSSCTTGQVLARVWSYSRSEGAVLPELLCKLDEYELRIADDDGEPDMDFPELDSTVEVTSFGVDEFVVCDGSGVVLLVVVGNTNGDVTLMLTVPEDADAPPVTIPLIEATTSSSAAVSLPTVDATATATATAASSKEKGHAVRSGHEVDDSAVALRQTDIPEEERLEFTVRNLDTDEVFTVQDADSLVPQCVNPQTIFSFDPSD